MAYEGYRLKINDVIFPNTFMAKGTWKCKPGKRRELDSYYTADGKRHIIYHHASKLEIGFNIREHNLADHEQIAPFFRELEKVSITAWDDTACEYVTKVCAIGDVTWASSAVGDDLIYKPTAVVITED